MQSIPLSISIHKIHERYMEKVYLLLQEERYEIDKLILSPTPARAPIHAPASTSEPTPTPMSSPTSEPTHIHASASTSEPTPASTASSCLYVNEFTIKSYAVYKEYCKINDYPIVSKQQYSTIKDVSPVILNSKIPISNEVIDYIEEKYKTALSNYRKAYPDTCSYTTMLRFLYNGKKPDDMELLKYIRNNLSYLLTRYPRDRDHCDNTAYLKTGKTAAAIYKFAKDNFYEYDFYEEFLSMCADERIPTVQERSFCDIIIDIWNKSVD